MHAAVMSWFHSRTFANLYGIAVLLAVLSDEVIPRLTGGKGVSFSHSRDRGSFLLIYLASAAGLGTGLYLRYHNVGVVPFWVQVLAIAILIAGTLLREWAIVLLGRFFSRSVQIEASHRLIMSGPFRWIRHPAYTGMLMMDVAIVLGLGTWVGALLMFFLLLLATLYRIRVEEQALVAAFGEQYRAYMQRTSRLFPRW